MNIVLYVENLDRELALFSAPVKRLLATLHTCNKLEAWDVSEMSYNYPKVTLCRIKPKPVDTPDGLQITNRSLVTLGIDEDPDQAMTIALAEFFERDAISIWNDKRYIRKKYEEIRKEAVDPQDLTFGVDDRQLGDLAEEMWWCRAYDVKYKTETWIPAQLTYIFYNDVFPDDPWLHNSTSNGVAAHTSKEGSLVRAFYELFERDAFLKHWLTKTTPKKIDLETVDAPGFDDFLKEVNKNELEIHLLDCMTEFSLPVLVMVLVDRKRTFAVRVSSEAGYDIEHMIRKLQQEIFKWLHHVPQVMEDQSLWDKNVSDIRTMHDRMSLWTHPRMFDETEFLISGSTMTYQEYCSSLSMKVPRTVNDIRLFLRKHNMSAYEVDQTTALSKRNGIYVSRYIVPELLPMYFKEKEKPLHATRLRCFHKNTKLSEQLFNENDLNITPHPFL